MEGSFSPILRKIAGEVVSKPKRNFNLPSQVCLEEWWLSRPVTGDGIAVSGRPIEIRKCDDAPTKFSLASPKRRFPSREFHSVNIVKRHGGTMLESSDGLLISLCGFINKSRTEQNGFSLEVCRDFLNGFPINWDDFTAQSANEESKSNECFIDGFTPAALDCFNGAQLHDLVLSFTMTESDHFIGRISDLLIAQAEHKVDVQLPKSSPTPLCSSGGLTSGNITAEASMTQLTKIEHCSIPAWSSLLGEDVLTPEKSITRASKRGNQKDSPNVSCEQSSISGSSSLLGVDVSTPENRITSASKKGNQKASTHVSCEQSPIPENSISKASEKKRQSTTLDDSSQQDSRRRSLRSRK